jgi:UDP-N-acetylmuramate dehydrogenase
MFIKSKPPNLQENIPLANHTTFRIGGPARYFFVAKSKEEFLEALNWAKENNLPYFMLGGGSNLLVSESGFDGLVIKIKNGKLKIKNYNVKFKIILAEAGAPLALLVVQSLENGLIGLEWAAGIPGTLGGAICGNAGAYRHSISEAVESVEVFNAKDQEIQSYSHKQCEFGYRESIFKKNQNLIILTAKLKLGKGDTARAQNFVQECLATRKNKIPSFPSAGSIFKNIEFGWQSENFKKLIPAEQIKGGMVAVGYLIEQCGLKGRQAGGAQISTQHANFIVNVISAKAADVLELINLCQESVKEKFGIELEKEIRIL